MPRVSVIIPVHDEERYLRECLDSVLGQTLKDIEVLCVDDGSTDATPEILAAYALRDARLTVIKQGQAGAGAARNAGLDSAVGEYLVFFDADDLLKPSMLEALHKKCIEDEADIGMCRVRYLHTSTKQTTPADSLLRMDLIPDRVPFSVTDMPEHILVFAANATWNKMFRRSFVELEELRFQEIARANDLVFTMTALVKARRITVVDKVLAYYRVGDQDTLQASSHETPFDFLEALSSLRTALLRMGLFDTLEHSFVNKAMAACLYNLGTASRPEQSRALYEVLKTRYFAEFGLAERNAGDFLVKSKHDHYQRIMSQSWDEYIVEEARRLRAELKTTRGRLRDSVEQAKSCRAELRRIKKSRSYRLGRMIRNIRRGFRFKRRP